MCAKVVLLFLLSCLVLLKGSSVEGKRYFGVGQRIVGDQLLLKDVQHSRPATLSEQPSVVFNYEIVEPITYIEIVSEENISAEVKFSYIHQLVVGVISLRGTNESTTELPPAFDVSIMIFGFNDTMLNVNPAHLLNRDQQFEGELGPFSDYDDDYAPYDRIEREEMLQVDELEQETEAPFSSSTDVEPKDKIIEIGHRQMGDELVYETYQTSPDVSKEETNHSVIFYYIDSEYITYVKFVIFDHFSDMTALDYNPPVAEYSHYSNSTLKAKITDFNTSSLFVQMFIYGYHANQVPATFEPFLPPPHWQRPVDKTRAEGLLTPLQRLQLALLLNQSTTPSAHDHSDSGEDDTEPRSIRPEEMLFEHNPAEATNAKNAALAPRDRDFCVLLGLLLLILHN